MAFVVASYNLLLKGYEIFKVYINYMHVFLF